MNKFAAAAAAAAAPAAAAASGLLPADFRAPAIPLLTADPFTQVWLRGDTATSASATPAVP